MITFIIIVVTIIVIVNVSKPDKHDEQKDRIAIEQLPSFTIHANTLSTLKQVGEVILDEHIITSFSFSNANVIVKYKNGRVFQSQLSSIEAWFGYSMHRRFVHLIAYNQDEWIQEAKGLFSDRDWDKIFYVLSLSNKTHDVDSISSKYRTQIDGISRARTMSKIIDFLAN